MSDRYRVSLDLSSGELIDAPDALLRAAERATGSDAALLRLFAEQVGEGRDEAAFGVEAIFTPRERADA